MSSYLTIKIINKKNEEETFETEFNEITTIYELKQYIAEKTNNELHNIHFLNNSSYFDNSMLIINTNYYINNSIYFINTKSKCATCGAKYAKIIGDCKFCKCKFCLNHRLPETHNCINMNICKNKAFNNNSNKVMSEKCVASKI
jgi:hypothetical protein